MKKIFFTLFCLTLCSVLMSQPLTKEEGYQIADRLVQAQILSERGANALRKTIDEDNFTRDHQPHMERSSVPIKRGLSVSQIMLFLGKAFMVDYQYRNGLFEFQKMGFNRDTHPVLDKEKVAILTKRVDSLQQHFIGFKIEEAIPMPEQQPKSRGFYATSIGGSFSNPLFNPGSIGLDPDLIHHSTSVMGKTCLKTLQALKSIDLINEEIFNTVKQQFDQGRLPMEYLLIAAVLEQVAYYEDFEDNKLQEIEFIQSLHAHGIIADEHLETLTSSTSNKKLHRKFELIEYCNHAKVFRVGQYSTEPSEAYPEIFEAIKEIVPNFKYQNLQADTFHIKDDWDRFTLENRCRIQFEANGKTYANEFFYDYKKINQDEYRRLQDSLSRAHRIDLDIEGIEPMPDSIAESYRAFFQEQRKQPLDTLLKISTEFHHGVNKFLADQNSEYRLYYANNNEPGKGAYGKNGFGLILMTEKQAKAWGHESYFLFGYSHDNRFNSDRIQKIISDYESIGLFSHLSKAEVSEAESCVLKSEIEGYQSILLCFPKTVLYFDWETGNLENPYEELTEAISDFSRGAFTPTDIQDNFEDSWEKETVDYSLTFKGKPYKATLKMESDWLDPGFMELIETALEENGVDGNLYYCLDDGQAGGYIFLTSKQYQFLSKHQPELFPKW